MFLCAYVVFDGQCEEAFKFYAEVLGGQIEAMMTYVGTPAEKQAPPDQLTKIIHARMRVGETLLMASDAPTGRYEKPAATSVHIGVDDPAEAERIYAALAEGGTVKMPIGKTFWAERFGMLVDRFGIPWMVNCEMKRG